MKPWPANLLMLIVRGYQLFISPLIGLRALRHRAVTDACCVQGHMAFASVNDWITGRSGWMPCDGIATTGWPIYTVIRGEVVVRDEHLLGEPQGQTIRFLEILGENQ